MTDAQKIFCDEYLKHLNATEAYKVAYPKVKTQHAAESNASRLLSNAEVKEYIAERMEERQKRTEITQDMIINELKAIAFANATQFAETKRNGVVIKDTSELPDEVKKVIVGIEDGKNGIKIKTANKIQALELLGRHLGMFNDKLDVNVKEKTEKKNAIEDILNQMKSVDDV